MVSVIIKNKERRIRGGARSELGGLLRGASAHLSPAPIADDSVRQCRRCATTGIMRRGIVGLVRFPRFRAVAIEMPFVAQSMQARNGGKRTNYALFAGQPPAGARLCISLEARGQGNKCVLLTVARNHKSASADRR